MSGEFDPYHRWLGIPPKQQPANYYRLLGLELFEDDPEVIHDAAERQMAHVRTYQLGTQSGLSQRILNELGVAKACLLQPSAKAVYDQQLAEEEWQMQLRNQVPSAQAPPAKPNLERISWKDRRIVLAACGLSALSILTLTLLAVALRPLLKIIMPTATADKTSVETAAPPHAKVTDAESKVSKSPEQRKTLPQPEKTPPAPVNEKALTSSDRSQTTTSTTAPPPAKQPSTTTREKASKSKDLPTAPPKRVAPPPAVAPFDETQAKEFQRLWAEHLGVPVEVTNSIGMRLVLIPPGEFMMGSPDLENSHKPNEGPRHPVRLAKPFYLGIYEVTQQEFTRVMGSNPSYFCLNGRGREGVKHLATERFPVENVSWNESVEFCRALAQEEKKVYRLPTEAEWEYACRAGTTTPFHFGINCNGAQANCDGRYPYGTVGKRRPLARTMKVGSCLPNAFGLYDMHGNVSEWCADWHNDGYYAGSPLDDPTGPSSGSSRVLRGGSWYSVPGGTRSASREGFMSDYRSNFTGFRIARAP